MVKGVDFRDAFGGLLGLGAVTAGFVLAWAVVLGADAVINLAGVPSIVHALFGVGAFVYFLGFGMSILAASLLASGYPEEQGYTISPRRSLFPQTGTELLIQPLLPGIRTLSGERIQHYLASELREGLGIVARHPLIRPLSAYSLDALSQA